MWTIFVASCAIKAFSFVTIVFQQAIETVVEAVETEIFFKIGALKNFANFTGKHLCWSLFFNNIAGLSHEMIILFLKCYLGKID